MSLLERVTQLLHRYAHTDDDAQFSEDTYSALGEWADLFTESGTFDITAYEEAGLLPETLPGGVPQVGRETIRKFATRSLQSRPLSGRPKKHMNFNTLVQSDSSMTQVTTDLLMLARDPAADGFYVIESAGRYCDQVSDDGTTTQFAVRKIVPFLAEKRGKNEV